MESAGRMLAVFRKKSAGFGKHTVIHGSIHEAKYITRGKGRRGRLRGTQHRLQLPKGTYAIDCAAERESYLSSNRGGKKTKSTYYTREAEGDATIWDQGEATNSLTE